jgi:hypothetical protein
MDQDATASTPPHPVAGWRERVDLPEWGLHGVRAKLDTGARTSAIDVATIEHLEDGRIRFEVVGRHKPTRRTKWVEAMPVRTSVVKPSHGKKQERFVCRTPIRIGEIETEIEISLVCRKNMLCRMLLGRTALDGRILVDSGAKYRLTEKSRKAHRARFGPPKRSGG